MYRARRNLSRITLMNGSGYASLRVTSLTFRKSMQNGYLPSFFLARTIGELQGLSDGSITPSASILSSSSSMTPCMNGFRGWYRCFTGSGCRKRISCWASGVSPRTVSNWGSSSARTAEGAASRLRKE
jgi:hypothetical protein